MTRREFFALLLLPLICRQEKSNLRRVDEACKRFGLEFLNYDEISEAAAFEGFPVRHSHWQWDMEYETLVGKYNTGEYIDDVVINKDPVYIYCLEDKT